MLKQERQAYILHQVNLHNQVLSASLSLDLNVSEDTVRRDLQELADNSKLIKAHGGALSLSFSDFHYPSTHVYAHPQKKLIAHKADICFPGVNAIDAERCSDVRTLRKQPATNPT